MRLVKHLTINGEKAGLVREHIWLDISTPGRADFTVRSPEKLSGIVQLAIGNSNQSKMVEFFTGYIEKSNAVDASQQRIFCRELCAVLWAIIPVSIRNASLKDILGVYARKTGLTIVTPDKTYAQTPCPAFQSIGNGIHGLDSLGAIFNIPGYIWQQQGNGEIYSGAWEDSRWAQNSFPVPEKFFQDVQLDGTKTMQAIPGLRPGVLMNDQYITSLQLNEHFMVIKCAKQLNESF